MGQSARRADGAGLLLALLRVPRLDGAAAGWGGRRRRCRRRRCRLPAAAACAAVRGSTRQDGGGRRRRRPEGAPRTCIIATDWPSQSQSSHSGRPGPRLWQQSGLGIAAREYSESRHEPSLKHATTTWPAFLGRHAAMAWPLPSTAGSSCRIRVAFILASPRTVIATSLTARAVVTVCTSSIEDCPSFILSRLSGTRGALAFSGSSVSSATASSSTEAAGASLGASASAMRSAARTKTRGPDSSVSTPATLRDMRYSRNSQLLCERGSMRPLSLARALWPVSVLGLGAVSLATVASVLV